MFTDMPLGPILEAFLERHADHAAAGLLDGVARVPGLDSLDLQVYPAWWAGQDHFERLLDWPARIRAADPGRRVILSETWLRKLGRNEQGKPPTDDQLQPARPSRSGRRSTAATSSCSGGSRAARRSSWSASAGRSSSSPTWTSTIRSSSG